MSEPKVTTWREKVDNLTKVLGRKPELHELMALAQGYEMTPEEREEQRQSFLGARHDGSM